MTVTMSTSLNIDHVLAGDRGISLRVLRNLAGRERENARAILANTEKGREVLAIL